MSSIRSSKATSCRDVKFFKTGFFISTGLFALTSGLLIFMLSRGSVKKKDDGRQYVVVTAAEKAHVLTEMRELLVSVHTILHEVSENNYVAAAHAAEKMGIVIGMSIYGFIDQITGSMRNAIVFFCVFFVVGALTLMRIPRNAVPKDN